MRRSSYERGSYLHRDCFDMTPSHPKNPSSEPPNSSQKNSPNEPLLIHSRNIFREHGALYSSPFLAKTPVTVPRVVLFFPFFAFVAAPSHVRLSKHVESTSASSVAPGAALAAAVFAFRSGPFVSGCTEIVSGRGGPMKGTRGNALIPAECAPRPAAASRAAPHAARCSAVNDAPLAERPPAMTITAAYEQAVRWPWYRWRCSSSAQALHLRSRARWDTRYR